jgi:epoxyqueuosine reductase
MVLKSYWTPQYEELVRRGSDPHDCLVAFYALGRDYHEVLNDGLAQLEKTCRVAGFATRTFVDSSPVMEKALAVRAGLGVRGRNSLLINPEFGSWVVLGGMLTTAALEPDAPLEREGEGLTGCGPCRLCLEACPTAAIREPGVIDSRRCLAYLTIEAGGGAGQGLCLEGKPPYVYGCDECQIVCPKNRNVRVGSPARFGPARARRAYAPEALRAMGPEEFEAEFGHSTVRRIGLDRFQRNVVRCRP